MNIYIGNLHYGVKENDLKEIMEEYGVVNSTKLIIDRNTGRSKGFGFVEMENDNEAGNAINSLNGADLEGRTMVVKEATPRASY
ncbi:MAG: RNA-binding protein [Tannerellaceae bacterium]|nr:RNA-binding protein [Tannerellaceae bacterium]